MCEPHKNSPEITRKGLSADEILALRDLRLNYPYNFAEPPYPEIYWQLFELIDHASFPLAKTDACDKWNCKEISPENFFQATILCCRPTPRSAMGGEQCANEPLGRGALPSALSIIS